MALHVGLGQLDADRETLYHQDYAREFEGDLIDIAPVAGIYKIGGMRTEDDAKDRGNSSLTDIQAFLDDGRAEHEQACKGPQEDVDQMGPIDRKLLPGHFDTRRTDVG